MKPDELAETWNRLSPRLLLIARSIGEPAEDAVQEAFLRLAEQSPPPQDPLAWLVRVTRNQLLQWRRSRWRRLRRERASVPKNWFDEGQQGLETSLDARRVADSLTGLPDELRQVIVMHLWGELTFQQIADVLGSSRSSVHRQFQVGIKQMKKQFNPEIQTTPSV